MAEKIRKTSITIRKPASEDGELTVPITGWDVHYGFKEEGIDVDPDLVIFNEIIAQLGVFEIAVIFLGEHAVTKIWVVEEKQ